ncbi:hypothetical protein E7X58_12060 [Streptomyces sp. A1499]|nr:hypothetical protein E7X58_12060 [Streptomyces sp. A1499]
MFSADDEALLVPAGGAHRAPTRLMARLLGAGGFVHENGLWHNFCGPVVMQQVRALDDVQVGCGADGI